MAAKKKAQRAKAGVARVTAVKKKQPTSASRSAKSAPSAATVSSRKAPSARQTSSRAASGVAKRVSAKSPAASVGSSAAKASAAGAPGEGALAPGFQLNDQAGESVSSAELAGQPYVLYFYPKDDTPGCTTEACAFRDALPRFEKLGVRVLGVSPDNSASHARFRDKYELPFTLLSDGEKELSTAYGAWALKKNYGREYMGVVRSTFLVDADGVIRKAWRGVKVNGHVEQVQAAAAALG